MTLGSTTLTVAANASRTSQTVTAELVTDQKLHCPTGGGDAGAMAIFSSDAADAPKTVTYTVTGADGNAVSAAHKAHPHYLGCFGSPQAFSGYTDGRTSRSVFVASDGLYEAALLPCGSVDTKPCFTFAESGGTVTLTIHAGPGDPKVTP
ncbi:hypothetical protein Back2_22400 [Nocardioides baekrokdamisoli]|uniref:Uncharacterized protein n=1 Tax=Nocardioides baekrokdamisoli TaxID=1804624 RepID=A0A3G9J016_9ACTN|nr:hypothetical protein Back2_22400 [Nocardioides baekrokdamisoli]